MAMGGIIVFSPILNTKMVHDSSTCIFNYYSVFANMHNHNTLEFFIASDIDSADLAQAACPSCTKMLQWIPWTSGVSMCQFLVAMVGELITHLSLPCIFI